MKKQIIAVGLNERELGTSFSANNDYSLRGLDKRRVLEFHEYLNSMGDNVSRYESNLGGGAKVLLLHKQGCEHIEIVGSWTQRCVSYTISRGVQAGMIVEAPEEFIFNSPFTDGFRYEGPPPSAEIVESVDYWHKKLFEKDAVRFDIELSNKRYYFKPK